MDTSSAWFSSQYSTYVGAYQVPASLRFIRENDTYMRYLFSDVNDYSRLYGRYSTFSCWIKRGNLQTGTGEIFAAGTGTGANCSIYFNASDQLVLWANSNSTALLHITSQQKFRDTTGWMHIVWQMSTPSGVYKLFINGEEVATTTTTNNYPTGSILYFGYQTTYVGAGFYNFFDGLIAQLRYVSDEDPAVGIQPPTAFAELAPNGIWRPKRIAIGEENMRSDNNNAPFDWNNQVATTGNWFSWIDPADRAPFQSQAGYVYCQKATTGTWVFTPTDGIQGTDLAVAWTGSSSYANTKAVITYQDDSTEDVLFSHPAGNDTTVTLVTIKSGEQYNLKSIHLEWIDPAFDSGDYIGGLAGIYVDGYKLIEDHQIGFVANGIFITGENWLDQGEDYSGNRFDFTSINRTTGFSSLSFDQWLDTPTNNRPSFMPIEQPRMSQHPGQQVISNANKRLTQQNGGGNASLSGSTVGVTGLTGKVFFGVQAQFSDSYQRMMGVCVTDLDDYQPEPAVGNDGIYAMARGKSFNCPASWGYKRVGFYSDGGADYSETGTHYPESSSYLPQGVAAYDNDTGKLWFGYYDGNPSDGTTIQWFGSDFQVGTADPATGTDPTYTLEPGMKKVIIYASCPDYNVGGIVENIRRNWSGYLVPPTGFEYLGSGSPDTTPIEPPAATSHFRVDKQNSNDADPLTDWSNIKTQYPNAIWLLKGSSSPYDNWQWQHSAQTGALSGITQRSPSLECATEVDVTGDGTLGSWNLDGNIVTDTSQEITSIYDTNVSAGVCAGTYVGNGSTDTSFAHGLGGVPEFIVFKKNSNDQPIKVYHKDLDYQYMMNMTDNGQQGWTLNGVLTTPTATSVNIGNQLSMNDNGFDHFFYMWKSVSGYSKFGSYTGNGNGSGPTVELGFEPALVIIKCYTTFGTSWVWFDNKNNTTSTANQFLEMNGGGALSYTGFTQIEFQSTGFQVTGTESSVNESGQSYIYAAWSDDEFVDADLVSQIAGAASSKALADGRDHFRIDLSNINDAGTLNNWSNIKAQYPNAIWLLKRLDAVNNWQWQNSAQASGVGGGFTQQSPSLTVATEVNIGGDAMLATWSLDGNIVTDNTQPIQSIYDTNVTAGICAGTYIGNGGSNTQFGHGLGGVPEFIIIKRSNQSNGFVVYHKDLAYQQVLTLTTTNAAVSSPTAFRDFPTSTMVRCGNGTAINSSGAGFYFYMWRSIPGFSHFGAYDGTGDTSGPAITLGFKPALIIVKCSSHNSTSWIWWDSTNNTHNPADLFLNPNATTALSTTTTAHIDFLSNGFKVRGNGNGLNVSGRRYVYAAWAENPFDENPPAN